MGKEAVIYWKYLNDKFLRGCTSVSQGPIRNYADGSPTRLCPACRAKCVEAKATGSLESKGNG